MDILIAHSKAVARKALEVARQVPHLEPDLRFTEEAALLHDIGMIRTHAPGLGCHGDLPYICHGVEGRLILEAEGLPAHALVCERHVGAGLTVSDIRKNKFPIPRRDMRPLSVEEKIVCFADKFFSKLGVIKEKPLREVRITISRYGEDKLRDFDSMTALLLNTR
jgi:uncharacterized protein